MQFDDPFEEAHLALDDIEKRLAGNRLGGEADEIDRVARGEGVADLALAMEAADARPLAGAWIDHHDRPLVRIDRPPAGGTTRESE